MKRLIYQEAYWFMTQVKWYYRTCGAVKEKGNKKENTFHCFLTSIPQPYTYCTGACLLYLLSLDLIAQYLITQYLQKRYLKGKTAWWCCKWAEQTTVYHFRFQTVNYSFKCWLSKGERKAKYWSTLKAK